MNSPANTATHQQGCRSITLPPSQAEVISLFNQYPGKYINTFDFRRNGIASPAQRIAELIMKGAIVDKKLKPAICELGRQHNGVAWYLFKGWA